MSCLISLQDSTCRTQHCHGKQHTDVGMVLLLNAVGHPQNHTECHRPGLPNGWSVHGNDPVGVSNNEGIKSVVDHNVTKAIIKQSFYTRFYCVNIYQIKYQFLHRKYIAPQNI